MPHTANYSLMKSLLCGAGNLLCLGTAFAIDTNRGVAVRRRPAKYPPTNLLAAIAFDRTSLRSVGDFRALPNSIQGRWLEWLLAQEIWRRKAIRGESTPEQLDYWQGGEHELDYVVRPDLMLECKRGGSSALEFAWFSRTFPKAELWIVGRDRFEGSRIRGRSFADVLLDENW